MHRSAITAIGLRLHTAESLAEAAAAGDPYAAATCQELMIDFERPADIIGGPHEPPRHSDSQSDAQGKSAAPELTSRGRAFWRRVDFKHFRQFRYAVYNASNEILSLHKTPRKAARECQHLNSQLR